MLTHDQRVALITGASSGIGLATSLMLAQRGWTVAMAARTPETLRDAEHAVREAAPGAHVAAFPCDVGEPGAARRLVEEVAARFGRLDALVNNAGLASLTPIDRQTEDAIARSFAVNALGPANAIAAAWPVFLRQKAGVVVNTSTKGTSDPFPGFFAYASAKASVNLMAQSAAKEGARHGIRAFAVAPGATETRMLRSMFSEKALPASAVMPPERVAGVIVDCIEGRRDEDNGKTIFLVPGQ